MLLFMLKNLTAACIHDNSHNNATAIFADNDHQQHVPPSPGSFGNNRVAKVARGS